MFWERIVGLIIYVENIAIILGLPVKEVGPKKGRTAESIYNSCKSVGVIGLTGKVEVLSVFNLLMNAINHFNMGHLVKVPFPLKVKEAFCWTPALVLIFAETQIPIPLVLRICEVLNLI